MKPWNGPQSVAMRNKTESSQPLENPGSLLMVVKATSWRSACMRLAIVSHLGTFVWAPLTSSMISIWLLMKVPYSSEIKLKASTTMLGFETYNLSCFNWCQVSVLSGGLDWRYDSLKKILSSLVCPLFQQCQHHSLQRSQLLWSD